MSAHAYLHQDAANGILLANSAHLLTCKQTGCTLSWLLWRMIGIFQRRINSIRHMCHAMHTWHLDVCRSSCFCGRRAASLDRGPCCTGLAQQAIHMLDTACLIPAALYNPGRRIPAAACATSARAACCGTATAAAAPETPEGALVNIYACGHIILQPLHKVLTRLCSASTFLHVVFIGKVQERTPAQQKFLTHVQCAAELEALCKLAYRPSRLMAASS